MSSNNNDSQKVKYIKSVYRHGSETFLLVVKDKKSLVSKNIIKSSTSENGINSIISECKGINWYNNLNQNKIIYNLEKKTKTYYKVKIDANKGFFNIIFNPNYLNVKKYLDLIINHYIQIWKDYKGCEFAPFHGDLSLVGNVMLNKADEVLFVDWEHFKNNSKIPTGLDIIMLLLENAFHDYKKYKKIREEVIIHVARSIKTLNRSKLLSPLLFQNPAMSTLNFINLNSYIWNKQFFKLPVLKFSKNNIEEIDERISKIL